MSLDIDLAPLWDAIETYFPAFFGILIVPAGIGISIALSQYLLKKVREAFM